MSIEQKKENKFIVLLVSLSVIFIFILYGAIITMLDAKNKADLYLKEIHILEAENKTQLEEKNWANATLQSFFMHHNGILTPTADSLFMSHFNDNLKDIEYYSRKANDEGTYVRQEVLNVQNKLNQYGN